ncbi:MAG: regulatory protein RecX [Thermotoga caldifontis]|uniref:regulatory protein RecX n=1 Tax=Thermotoga caldifontis TaxID=1508419 RepID=UPI003C7D5D38
MQLNDALKYAKRLLKFRVRSRAEIRDRLSMKGFDPETIEAVIDRLEKSGFLDDEKFAYLYASDMLVVHGYGPVRIKMKLKQLKVDGEIIDRVLKRVMQETDVRQVMKKLLESRKLSGHEAREFLFRRGFTTKEIDLLEEGGAET